MSAVGLPPGVVLLERGWLSSNNIVLLGNGEAAVVDSGYWTHAAQTIDLVERVAQGRAMTTLVNTHLHSDHCGGNAALQAAHPALRTLIPPGQAAAVRDWDPVALSHEPTGQACPAFRFDDVLVPGTAVRLGAADWEVHAAPGHDPHSVILFEPASRTAISADALWENGFGIVFPELEGERAFEEVSATLDLIERLSPRLVLPGHGRAFTGVAEALARARSRLAAYVADPRRHAAHAAKVLLKFKLLELQQVRRADFLTWAENAAYLRLVHERFASGMPLAEWVDALLRDLAASGALREENGALTNA
ncbi:MBL fold metallo-hydrolase [Ramlibacter sp. USB13]|uniref:MBL fold metallo-hydrolase n=1 Tax=Ramlibacter cellulosilyticus TaxID=2764187 RepID=A0A923MTM9_9BURK|nr:MBL fold metallo-hydrolase [Ramlibacter cellulosilyticus]MBC5783964.1 MBL fold metallo-hydrolase [Ramlibacter cellulosilyticus]